MAERLDLNALESMATHATPDEWASDLRCVFTRSVVLSLIALARTQAPAPSSSPPEETTTTNCSKGQEETINMTTIDIQNAAALRVQNIIRPLLANSSDEAFVEDVQDAIFVAMGLDVPGVRTRAMDMALAVPPKGATADHHTVPCYLGNSEGCAGSHV